MSETVTVRCAGSEDASALCESSRRAILGSAAAHYASDQLKVWAARRTVASHLWMVRNTHVLIAEVDQELAGFCSVALRPVGALQAGEVDQVFVSPDHGGRGVARILLSQAASAGRDAGLTRLVTHASWRAVPVFERLGYQRVLVETVDLDGVSLTRVLMAASLE
jgi:putative acetyltransferase